MATTRKTKAKPVIEEMVTVAILDANKIYLGMEQIKKSELTPSHVQLPDGCDLPVGKYGWNSLHGMFMPTLQYINEQRALGKNRKRGS
jgi:hypothetical protein